MSALVLIQYFQDKHKGLIGEPYLVNWGKDNRIMKNMITVYGMEKVRNLIDIFLHNMESDKFLQQTGMSIGIMQTQIPKLIMQLKDWEHDKNIGRL